MSNMPTTIEVERWSPGNAFMNSYRWRHKINMGRETREPFIKRVKY